MIEHRPTLIYSWRTLPKGVTDVHVLTVPDATGPLPRIGDQIGFVEQGILTEVVRVTHRIERVSYRSGDTRTASIEIEVDPLRWTEGT